MWDCGKVESEKWKVEMWKSGMEKWKSGNVGKQVCGKEGYWERK